MRIGAPKTAAQEKFYANTIRYLRDCGYAHRKAADAMGLHPTQLRRIADRHGIKFGKRKERSIYQKRLNEQQWQSVEVEIRHWYDVSGDYRVARMRTAASWGVPVKAIDAYERRDLSRLG